MRRRIVLQWFASLFPLWGQTGSFPNGASKTLRQLAALVLPSETNPDLIAQQFETYVREYRPGADTEHGYGVTRVRPKPASPAPVYLQQLNALPSPLTRQHVEAALEAAQIKEIPRAPEGKSVIADLMSFYFRSSGANDLCYRAAIQRETCRGLDGSSKPPAPLPARGKESAA